MVRTTILCMLIAFAASCNNSTESLKANQISKVQDSVGLMAESIAKNVSHEGPTAWLRYFENSPDFFMASDGQIVFPNNSSAKNIINTILSKNISQIELHWSNVRIDPLTSKLAAMAAVFHEYITDSSGRKLSYNGYFTAVAHQTPQGWKLHNAHWSIIKNP